MIHTYDFGTRIKQMIIGFKGEVDSNIIVEDFRDHLGCCSQWCQWVWGDEPRASHIQLMCSTT